MPFADAMLSRMHDRAATREGRTLKHQMTPTKFANIDTGYRVVAGSIDRGSGPTGYHVAEERILHGTVDTGYFLAGETIYKRPRLDTGFRVSSGIVWGPGSELPFLAERLE